MLLARSTIWDICIDNVWLSVFSAIGTCLNFGRNLQNIPAGQHLRFGFLATVTFNLAVRRKV